MKGKAARTQHRGQVLTEGTAVLNSQSFPSCTAPPGRDAGHTSSMPQTPAGPQVAGRDSQCSRDRPQCQGRRHAVTSADSSRQLLDPLCVCRKALSFTTARESEPSSQPK